MIPMIGESVEWRGRLFDVVNRNCCGYSGWMLTIRSRDDRHELSVLASQCTRVSPPVVDNVVRIRPQLRVIQGGLA